MAILPEGETRCPRNVSDITDIDKLPNSYPGQSPIQRVRVIQHMDLLESIARIEKDSCQPALHGRISFFFLKKKKTCVVWHNILSSIDFSVIM